MDWFECERTGVKRTIHGVKHYKVDQKKARNMYICTSKCCNMYEILSFHSQRTTPLPTYTNLLIWKKRTSSDFVFKAPVTQDGDHAATMAT